MKWAMELRDVPSDSSASDVERTIEYAGRVADKARELKEHVEGDADAQRMAESPGDSAEGDAYAALLGQVADRMRDRIAPQWRRLGEEAARILGVAAKLLAEEDDDARRGAGRLRDELQRTMASLQTFLDGELQGANDPEVRAKIELGKNEHKRIQADSSKCTASELTFGSRRIDCIRVEGTTCYVVEIKPNNGAARDKGRAQIADGIKKILEAAGGKKTRAELTGALEVFRPCFNEATEQLLLAEELRVYEYCPPDGELYKDFVVP